MLIWVLPALLSGIIRAYAYDINRTHQIDGRTMNFWRIIAAIPAVLALSAFVAWPTDPKFYLVCLAFGASIGVGDTYLWQLAAKGKTRISTMFGPLNAFGSFVIWLFVSATAFTELTQNPLVFAAVCFCYGLLLAGIWMLRKCTFSWPAIKGLLIVCSYNSVCIILVRLVVSEQADYIGSTVVMVLGSYTAGILFSLVRYLVQERGVPKLTKKQVLPTFTMGVLLVFTTLCAIFAYTQAPNPGYALALVALAPMWLAILHKLQKVENKASLMPIMLILFSAIGLTLLAN